MLKEINTFKETFVEGLSELCGKWAGIVYDHPWKVIILGVIVALGSLIGFLPGIAFWLDGAENLYALPQTQAKNDGIIHNALFKESLTLPNFAIVTTDPPGDNVFTWRHLSTALQIDQLIRGKFVDPVKGRRVAIPALPKFYPGIRAAEFRRKHKGENSTLPHQSSRYPPSVRGYDLRGLDSRPQTRDVRSIMSETESMASSSSIRRPYRADRSMVGSASTGEEDDANRAQVITYEDICARNPFGRCQVMSVFEAGIMDMKKILPLDAPPELYVMNNTIFNVEKKGFVPSYMLGGITIEPCERELPTNLLGNFFSADKLKPGSTPSRSIAQIGCVTAAKALHFIYEMEDVPEFFPRNLAWMETYYSILSDNRHFNGILIGGNAFKSRDDELRRSTSESQDIIYVVFTFIIVISYTAFINFSCDLYRNRTTTALAGSLATILGVLCGFGYTSLMGVSFVPTGTFHRHFGSFIQIYPQHTFYGCLLHDVVNVYQPACTMSRV